MDNRWNRPTYRMFRHSIAVNVAAVAVNLFGFIYSETLGVRIWCAICAVLSVGVLCFIRRTVSR